MLLEPEYLDKIYTFWKIQDRQSVDDSFVPTRWDYQQGYQRTYRNGFNQQRFENWLFEQGFSVIQRHGKRYLKFGGDESALSLFMLKHS